MTAIDPNNWKARAKLAEGQVDVLTRTNLALVEDLAREKREREEQRVRIQAHNTELIERARDARNRLEYVAGAWAKEERQRCIDAIRRVVPHHDSNGCHVTEQGVAAINGTSWTCPPAPQWSDLAVTLKERDAAIKERDEALEQIAAQSAAWADIAQRGADRAEALIKRAEEAEARAADLERQVRNAEGLATTNTRLFEAAIKRAEEAEVALVDSRAECARFKAAGKFILEGAAGEDEKLRAEIARLKRGDFLPGEQLRTYACMSEEGGGHPWCPHVEEMVRDLVAERDRFKAGDFTLEEIHNFCHKVDAACGSEAFAQGCVEYQRRMFGCAPDRDQIDALKAENKRLFDAQLLEGSTIEAWSTYAKNLKAENEKLRAALDAKVEECRYLGDRSLHFMRRADRYAEALRQARDTFREYERIHLAKISGENESYYTAAIEGKAARNRAHAEAIEKVLREK